jgi:hypothetical protein
MANAIPPTPVPDQLIGTDEALRQLFPEAVRPSADWLRRLARSRRVTHRRIGKNLLFQVNVLARELDRNFLIRARH